MRGMIAFGMLRFLGVLMVCKKGKLKVGREMMRIGKNGWEWRE